MSVIRTRALRYVVDGNETGEGTVKKTQKISFIFCSFFCTVYSLSGLSQCFSRRW